MLFVPDLHTLSRSLLQSSLKLVITACMACAATPGGWGVWFWVSGQGHVGASESSTQSRVTH